MHQRGDSCFFFPDLKSIVEAYRSRRRVMYTIELLYTSDKFHSFPFSNNGDGVMKDDLLMQEAKKFSVSLM